MNEHAPPGRGRKPGTQRRPPPFWLRSLLPFGGEGEAVERLTLSVSVLFTGCLGGGLAALSRLVDPELDGRPVILLVLSGFLLGGAVPLVRSTLVSNVMWTGVRRLFEPSGGARSGQQGYSRAEALAARGWFEAAISAYEECAAERPGDPEPRLRIARLLRDELGRLEAAARRLRRLRDELDLSPRMDAFVARELIELYRDRLRAPERAIPELARLAELYPDTPDGRWADAERRRLRAEILEAEHAEDG